MHDLVHDIVICSLGASTFSFQTRKNLERSINKN